ncbi:TrmB family transcriptional regulator [Parasporobacterium paucivorans]|uniref:Sugar-specific transcriptional regulator TrmB n=1 Tax=Parasporobacterium paucivorans DSM 15970 TaxID=1122934 RepID=A0A1M6AET5_9FIRM|nr:TrmB family transcriptional regulator [Parasporobacterium paucivorans]SHI34985.1 Sugar-specific transcriptional regulator TrmB [Parasporobacterium paucivorans DSM 15970]
MDNIELLMAFGLTRQEATLYLTLYKHGSMSGYEAAKQTGISRSNAYSALAGMVEKGAAFIIEGTVTKYIQVPVNEFCSNKLKNLETCKDTLSKNMPAQRDESDAYITITGTKHILEKVQTLLTMAEQRIYLSLPSDMIELLQNEIDILVKKRIKVVIITERNLRLPGAKVYKTGKIDNQVRMIVDSRHVLTGDFDKENSSCLYSGNKNLVDVFKDALRNEMKLIELTKGDM